MRRVGRTAMCRPTPPRPASALLSAHRCAGSASPHDNDERALSRWYFVPCSRAADLAERIPIASSGAACAVLAAPPSADRHHHVQLRCCSPPIAAPAPQIHAPTTSARRAASSSFLPRAPPAMPLARARRFVGRRVRRVGRAAERRPSSSRPAPLLLTAHRRTSSTSPRADNEQTPNPERVVPPSSVAGHAAGANSSIILRAPRAPCWPRRRAPTDATTLSSAAIHR